MMRSELNVKMMTRNSVKKDATMNKVPFRILQSLLLAVVLFLSMSGAALADTTTLVPDGVVSSGGWTGVTVGNLSDGAGGAGGGDGTYATITGTLDTFTVSMSNDAAYSGATINSVTTWVRASVVGGGGAGEKIIFGTSAPAVSTSGANTLSDDPTRDNFSWVPTGITNSTDVDAIEVSVSTDTLGGGEEVRIFEVWVVVDYTPVAGQNELNTCSGCHAEPPLEAATRNATGSGEVVGSHATHGVYACTVCHPNNAVLNHRGAGSGDAGGSIDTLASIQGGFYDENGDTINNDSTGFTQDNDITGTGLGSCRDVSCHGGASSVTPTWGTSGGLSCDGCHGAPPTTNGNIHGTHYTAKGWGATDVSGTYCVQCHPDNTGGHSDVTDSTVIINAGLTPSGTSPAISCGNAPALGCHNGKATPNWDTTGITCQQCHTAGGTDPADPTTGLHDETGTISGVLHNPSDANFSGCEDCHTATPSDNHWDGTAQTSDPIINFDAGVTGFADGTPPTCASSCHSDSGNWARAWHENADLSDGSSECAGCHGTFGDWRAGTSHEQTFNGSASTRGSGHNSGSGVCEDCHSYSTLPANHMNNQITMNDPGTGITEGGGRAWCADCHSDDGAPTTDGTHTFTQSIFTLQTVDGANDPVGSCTGCHGTGGANYWPDNSTAHVANDQPGKHAEHMQLLARRVYNQSLAELIADGATDTKQKSLCDYCHKATSQDTTHNNGTANVFPSATNALRFQDGASDTGTLASFNSGDGTCSSVDCHNSKTNTSGTYGWYDAGAADCDMCHTPGGHAEDFANPTSGLHNITPTISGVQHSDALVACDTCHSAIPDNYLTQSSAHVNGTFTADSGSNTDRYLFADYTDGTPGTCAGGNVGGAGCHDGGGDAGTWKRRWSTTAANSNGTECDNCHGGVNGEGTWTFGANNTTGDGSMSHDRNWDGEGALEVIGQHSADTSDTDRCNTCHVYGDAEYGTFGWEGASNHGNNKIDMNDSLGYSRSGGDAYGCTSNCHTTPGSHLTEASGWTLGLITGPSLGCDSCHGASNPAAGVNSSSPHTISTVGGSFISCGECHPGDGVGTQHTATGVVGIPNKTNVGIEYVDGVNSYSGYAGIVLGGTATSGATEAEICWNCHDQNNNGNLNDANEPNEFGLDSAGSYNYGTLNNKNWFSASWASGAGFTYKNGGLTTQLNANGASTHGTKGGSRGVDSAATIGCSYCHDVHNTFGGDSATTGPFLRGTWIGNRYGEDGAPLTGTTYAGGTNKYSVAGKDAPPRTHAGANATGGWQIDANNGDPNSGVTFAQHAGICTLCHGDGDAVEGEAADLAAIESAWSGHVNTVAGASHNGTNNIFSNSKRNGTGNYATGMWMGAVNSTGYNGSWMHGMRNADGGNGLTTGDSNVMLVNGKALAYNEFAWNVSVDPGTVDASFHNFTCSKCHNPHASRLPRLMITNCLDVRHNTWDDDFLGASNWATWQGYTRNNNKELAYASTAQNCHRYADMPVGSTVEETGWNSVTPW